MKKTLNLLILLCLSAGIVMIHGCKKEEIPTVTTTAVSGITINSATSGGNVTSDGGAEVTARGVCWGTSTNPISTGSHTSDGTGTGSFTSSITGLTPNTMYYVRAYATNSEGTAYGSEVTFTTSPILVATLTTTAVTSITSSTAVSGGNITADGGGTVTARGVCWAATANPTTTNSKTTDGGGTGIFTSNITGLTPGTAYHVRAYATNSAGTAYGNDLTFTSLAVAPTLTTTAVTGITTTSAASGGNITADGGSAVTARGVCWGIASNPTVAGSHTTNGDGVGTFTSSITGLTPNTLYYVRAYATNSIGTSYGNEVSFTSSQVVLATLSTTAITSVTSTTAVSGGNITADGGGAVTARGVCWATTVNPTTANSKTTDASGTGSFTSNIAGLTPGTLYHVRAYATNSAGTAYGNDLSFTTTAVVPTVSTTGVTGITQTTANSGGNVTSDGGAGVTARGVCWGTTSGPLAGGSHTTNGTGTGTFTSSITGLTAGTLYYVRAYATNSIGTAYGNEVSFTASSIVLATLTTTTPASINENTAESGGNITDSGGGTISGRGVCWSTSANPTIADSHTNDGPGTGSFTSNLTGLTAGSIYYLRAYATNGAGTAYGSEFKISTSIADVDGNVYRTVSIGTQLWMAENLKTTRFNDNAIINLVSNGATWAGLTGAAYCWYGNDQAVYEPLYGALYNWYAANAGNLCPTGWHVPTYAEFRTLELSIQMPLDQVDLYGWHGTDQGSKLKNTTGWDAGGNGNNSSGFSAAPGGYRYYLNGSFYGAGSLFYMWLSTEDVVDPTYAWYRRLENTHNDIYSGTVEKKAGKAVRCVKD